MKIGIIGGGYVGLTAGYRLAQKGHDVTILEASDAIGGLARGFKDKKWNWSLEEHYHHWFTNDEDILSLAQEIGCKYQTYRPKTSILQKGKKYQFDSPISLLKFPHLSLIDKVRTAGLMMFLKLTPFLKYYEKVTTKRFVIKWGGGNAWNILWGPLMKGKFGKHADKIPLVWFWARIKKRTSSLAYPDGGFRNFTNKLADEYKKAGGSIKLNTSVDKIEKVNDKIVVYSKKKKHSFDKVISTLPNHIFFNVAKGLPNDYKKKTKSLEGLSAVTLVLSIESPFFVDGTYWLNINENGYPFLAVVEHTNMVGSTQYNMDNILYVGNYLPTDHKYMKMSEKQLINEFTPALRKINPEFSEKMIKNSLVFRAPFAQPIVPMNYSKNILPLQSPIDGLYLANMQQVYPWDRGTNYAVEIGEKVAELVDNSK